MEPKLSPLEQKALKIIKGRKKPVSSKELIRKLYPKEQPFHAGPAVVSIMKGLARKLPGRIFTSGRKGPKPADWWMI